MKHFWPFVVLLWMLAGCRTDVADSTPPLSPHKAYLGSLLAAGLSESLLARAWIEAAEAALRPDASAPLPTSTPLAFDAAEPTAWSTRIEVKRGEVLLVEIVPVLGRDSARVFADVFVAAAADSLPVGSRLWSEVAWSAVDSTENPVVDTLRFERTASRDDALVLRVQPELLVTGTASVRIETRPSLAFPVDAVDERAIRSKWGAPRDGGARRHEGVDIFAPRGTPVIAAASGRVTRVNETPLGGRVVWLRTRRASLYYAHLDSQLVRRGERVQPGDTLGLVGNTGNARTTPPHLHFGVYTGGGAVDPYPFLVGRRGSPRTATP